MIKRLLTMPLNKFTIFIVFNCAAWLALHTIINVYAEHRLKGKRNIVPVGWKCINAVLAVICVDAILYVTVLNRHSQGERCAVLRPFYNIRLALRYREYQYEKLLNVYAFIPLGLTMSVALPDRIKRRALLTILTGFSLSFIMEAVQFVCRLGLAETDDVIANTFGTVLGTAIWLLGELIVRLILKRTQASKYGGSV